MNMQLEISSCLATEFKIFISREHTGILFNYRGNDIWYNDFNFIFRYSENSKQKDIDEAKLKRIIPNKLN